MKLLIPVDTSAQSHQALAFLARRPKFVQQGDPVLLTVQAPLRPSLVQMLKQENLSELQERLHQEVADAIAPYLQAIPHPMTLRSTQGHPVDQILAVAEQENVDLIMMGAHGERHFSDLIMGSVSRGVLAKAPCPVMLVREQLPPAMRPLKVVVPVDRDELSSHAVDWILAHRELFSAQTDFRLVHAVESSLDVLPHFTAPSSALEMEPKHVHRDKEWYQEVDPHAPRFQAAGFLCKNVALAGRPSKAIADYVTREDIDMIVMATHTRGELRSFFLGSVASEVLSLTKCPMVIVR